MSNIFQPLLAASSGGGGTGTGSKNYLSVYTASTSSNTPNTGNGDFELGTTAGWSLGNVSLTNNFPSGSPTFGSGASANLAFAVVTSNQLAATTSGSYSSSTLSVAGNFLSSNAFFIDLEDQSKVMTIKFYYSVTSGSSGANFSGTSANSFGIAIWDVTNSVWIQPAGYFGITQGSGVGYATATFQTTSNSTQYRLVLYNANATTGSFTMLVDDFVLGPQTAPLGVPASDPVAYTPSISAGAGTVTSTSFTYQRLADRVIIAGSFTTGSVAGSLVSISLPSGLSLNTSKLSIANTTSNPGVVVGEYVGGTTTGHTGAVVTATATSTTLVYLAGNVASAAELTPANGTSALSSTEIVSVNINIPISGYSSNVQMSSETDTRIVTASYFASANGTASTTQTVNFDTKIYDTHGAVTASAAGTGSWKFTAPVPGYYSLTGQSISPTGSVNAFLYKNGSIYAQLNFMDTTSGLGVISYDILLNAGDFIDIRFNTSATYGGAVLSGQNTCSKVVIKRVSGPPVIAASESVNGRYFSSTTSLSGSLATVLYATKSWDSHGFYNPSTGVWTCGLSGRYIFNAAIATAGTIAINNALDLQIQQTGSSSQISESLVDAGGAVTNLGTSVSDEFYCLSGDTIKVQVSSGATLPTVVSSNSKNFFSWTRVGN